MNFSTRMKWLQDSVKKYDKITVCSEKIGVIRSVVKLAKCAIVKRDPYILGVLKLIFPNVTKSTARKFPEYEKRRKKKEEKSEAISVINCPLYLLQKQQHLESFENEESEKIKRSLMYSKVQEVLKNIWITNFR